MNQSEIAKYVIDFSNMEAQILDELMQKMQYETMNNAGEFRFLALHPIHGKDSKGKFISLLSQLTIHKNPFHKPYDKDVYIEGADLKNLVLIPIENLGVELLNFIEIWAKQHGSHNIRKENSEIYPLLRSEFISKVLFFLNLKKIKTCNIIKGIDTYYSFHIDHINEDILIETEERLYIIHFGLSS